MTDHPQRILVTGGAGFIGSAVVRRLVGRGYHVVNLDKLTYSGNLQSLKEVEGRPNYRFVEADICDRAAIAAILAEERIEAVMHLAAESHVDRSIDGPGAFVETNVVGTFRLLAAALEYWRELPAERQSAFRFHHISTDEVFGDLPFDEGIFTEETPYSPSSPYSASKAAFNKRKVPTTLVSTKMPGPSIDRSTWLSAARCITASGCSARSNSPTKPASQMLPWTKR